MGRPPAWRATGQCVVGVAWSARAVGTVPAPLRRVPGPVLVAAARYTTSPVGPYLELTVLEPVRAGARAGMCATVMVVDSQASLDAGRAGWGFPKQLGSLRWSPDDGAAGLRWEEGDVEIACRSFGPAVPLPLPAWVLQAGGSGVVGAGAVLRGRARPSTVRVDAGPGSALAGVAGRHPGLALSEGTLRLGAAL